MLLLAGGLLVSLTRVGRGPPASNEREPISSSSRLLPLSSPSFLPPQGLPPAPATSWTLLPENLAQYENAFLKVGTGQWALYGACTCIHFKRGKHNIFVCKK